jgi:hypothetical protein
MGGRGGLEGVGAWAGGSFSCVQNMPCEQYVYIYIYIYMYIYLTYKASRLVDQHLDADRRIRNEELEWNINI